jgi:hypothetical protein
MAKEKPDRISALLQSAAAHLRDSTTATPLCLHAKQCPPVKSDKKRHG